MAEFGNAAGIQTMDSNTVRIINKADFQSSCVNMCQGSMAKSRQYAYVMENRLEINYAWGFCCCCTCDEKCVNDNIHVYYYDRRPTRVGMCCFVIPCTCCGPPVIYSFTPKCCCISLVPCYGVQIKAAPCNVFGLKCCLCFGNPCYESCGVPILASLSEQGASNFLVAYKAAVDNYLTKNPNYKGELAIFQAVSDNVGALGGAQDVGAPAVQTMA